MQGFESLRRVLVEYASTNLAVKSPSLMGVALIKTVFRLRASLAESTHTIRRQGDQYHTIVLPWSELVREAKLDEPEIMATNDEDIQNEVDVLKSAVSTTAMK